jgi:hypothetical protein
MSVRLLRNSWTAGFRGYFLTRRRPQRVSTKEMMPVGADEYATILMTVS